MKASMMVAAVVGGVSLITGSALATGIAVGHIQMADSYGTTAGGEFRAIAQADFTGNAMSTGTAFQGGIAAAPGLFETFCVEKFETINLSGTTYAAAVNTTTQSSNSNYAGGAHGGFNDPLDAKTAYLYTHFINHNLTSGYDYVNAGTRATDANALQTAIWYIEQEDSTPLTGLALSYYNEANNAVVGGSWSGIGNVRILNLTTASGADAQDQLIMQGTSIPLPTTAGLGAAGLVGAGLRRRRRN